jgi:hypothetical protein
MLRSDLPDRVRRLFEARLGHILALGAIAGLGAWMVPAVAGKGRPGTTPALPRFTRIVLDPKIETGGDSHKAHLLGRFSRDRDLDAGAETKAGFTLYRYAEKWKPYVVFHDNTGPEDAHAADIDGDGWNDIVIGGWSHQLIWAQNPAGLGKDPYATTWKLHTVDSTRFCHDSFPADIDHDGKCDIVTNAGIYFQGANPDTWTFRDIGMGPNTLGVAIGNLLNNRDGFLDIVAVRQTSGHNEICWYENPGHTNGDPRTGTWTVHVIDPLPGGAANVNCNEMSLALGDLDADGHIDVVAACQGEGPRNDVSQLGDGLVWYRAPRDPRQGTWKKTVIHPDLGYIHTSSLQLADFDGDEALDISFAQQEQSGPTPDDPKGGEPDGKPRQMVGIYYNAGRARGWRLQVLTQYPDKAAGGFNSKVGRIGADRLPSILTANHGFFGQPNPVVLFRAAR